MDEKDDPLSGEPSGRPVAGDHQGITAVDGGDLIVLIRSDLPSIGPVAGRQHLAMGAMERDYGGKGAAGPAEFTSESWQGFPPCPGKGTLCYAGGSM